MTGEEGTQRGSWMDAAHCNTGEGVVWHDKHVCVEGFHDYLTSPW